MLFFKRRSGRRASRRARPAVTFVPLSRAAREQWSHFGGEETVSASGTPQTASAEARCSLPALPTPEEVFAAVEKRKPTGTEATLLHRLAETAETILPPPEEIRFEGETARESYRLFWAGRASADAPALRDLWFGAGPLLEREEKLSAAARDGDETVWGVDRKSDRFGAYLGLSEGTVSVKKTRHRGPEEAGRTPDEGDLLVRLTPVDETLTPDAFRTLVLQSGDLLRLSGDLLYVSGHPWRDISRLWKHGLSLSAEAFSAPRGAAFFSTLPVLTQLPTLRAKAKKAGIVVTHLGQLLGGERIMGFGAGADMNFHRDVADRLSRIPSPPLTEPLCRAPAGRKNTTLRRGLPAVGGALGPGVDLQALPAEGPFVLTGARGAGVSGAHSAVARGYWKVAEPVLCLGARGFHPDEICLLPVPAPHADPPDWDDFGEALGRFAAQYELGLDMLGKPPQDGDRAERHPTAVAVHKAPFAPVPSGLVGPGHPLVWLSPTYGRDGLPIPGSLAAVVSTLWMLMRSRLVVSAVLLDETGVAGGLLALTREGTVGIKVDMALPVPLLFRPAPGSYLVELCGSSGGVGLTVGMTDGVAAIRRGRDRVALDVLRGTAQEDTPVPEGIEEEESTLQAPPAGAEATPTAKEDTPAGAEPQKTEETEEAPDSRAVPDKTASGEEAQGPAPAPKKTDVSAGAEATPTAKEDTPVGAEPQKTEETEEAPAEGDSPALFAPARQLSLWETGEGEARLPGEPPPEREAPADGAETVPAGLADFPTEKDPPLPGQEDLFLTLFGESGDTPPDLEATVLRVTLRDRSGPLPPRTKAAPHRDKRPAGTRD